VKFFKVGGNNNFGETGGEMYGNMENREKFEICGLKKGHQKFWWMKIGKFFGKR